MLDLSYWESIIYIYIYICIYIQSHSLRFITPPDQGTTRKTTTTPNRKHATTMDCNGVPFVIDVDAKFIADPEQDDITTMTTPEKRSPYDAPKPTRNRAPLRKRTLLRRRRRLLP